MMHADVLEQMLAIFDRAETLSDQQPFRYRFSSAADPCLRALVYDAQDADDGKPPAEGTPSLKRVLQAVCGKAIGAHLERAARELGYSTQLEAEFNTGAVRVTGSSDITKRAVFVVDIKIVSDSQWAKKPRAKDIEQVNGYAVAQDCPLAAVLYGRLGSLADKSPDFEVSLHVQDASIEVAQKLCATWEQVDQHRKLRTLPERVFEAAPHKWPCGWCRHKSRCLTQEVGEC